MIGKIYETVKHSAVRLGCIPACIALGACDIGKVLLDGMDNSDYVAITWGRSLESHQVNWYLQHGHDVVKIDNYYEIILDWETAQKLLEANK